MFKRLKAWREKRQKEAGYNWAINSYLITGATIEVLQEYVDCSRALNTYDSFDKGIERAISYIKEVESGDIKP